MKEPIEVLAERRQAIWRKRWQGWDSNYTYRIRKITKELEDAYVEKRKSRCKQEAPQKAQKAGSTVVSGL